MTERSIFITASAEETERLGARLANALGEQSFVAFYGTLGAGKTAFIRGMASVLCPEAPVQSPTYTVINEYKRNGRTALVHVDAYRVGDDDDLWSTGFYDCVEYENCVTAVEWCEKIPFAVPEGAVRVTVEYGERENERRITVENLDGDI